MSQLGFFDIANRYAGLDAKKDPLLTLDTVVPWEGFRDRLETLFPKAREGVGGQIIDASIVSVPSQHNSRDENTKIKAGETPEDWAIKPAKRCQKDTDAR